VGSRTPHIIAFVIAFVIVFIIVFVIAFVIVCGNSGKLLRQHVAWSSAVSVVVRPLAS
jgi:hypothetical protein